MAPGFHLAMRGGLVVGGGGAGFVGAVELVLHIVVLEPLALPRPLENFLFPLPLKSWKQRAIFKTHQTWYQNDQ